MSGRAVQNGIPGWTSSHDGNASTPLHPTVEPTEVSGRIEEPLLLLGRILGIAWVGPPGCARPPPNEIARTSFWALRDLNELLDALQ